MKVPKGESASKIPPPRRYLARSRPIFYLLVIQPAIPLARHPPAASPLPRPLAPDFLPPPRA